MNTQFIPYDTSMLGIASFIGTVIIIVIFKYGDVRDGTKIGIFLLSFVRDINKLLKSKLIEWEDLPLGDKINILLAVYQIIENYNEVINTDEFRIPSNETNKITDESIAGLINEIDNS